MSDNKGNGNTPDEVTGGTMGGIRGAGYGSADSATQNLDASESHESTTGKPVFEAQDHDSFVAQGSASQVNASNFNTPSPIQPGQPDPDQENLVSKSQELIISGQKLAASIDVTLKDLPAVAWSTAAGTSTGAIDAGNPSTGASISGLGISITRSADPYESLAPAMESGFSGESNRIYRGTDAPRSISTAPSGIPGVSKAQQNRAAMPVIEGDMRLKRRPVTQNTMTEYRKRVSQRTAHSAMKRSAGVEGWITPTPLEVVEDMLEQRAEWKKATWCLYRAAMLWELAPQREIHADIERAWQLLSDAPTGALPTEPRVERKKFPKSDFVKVLDQLLPTARPSIWKQRAGYMLASTMVTGLRPTEWAQATWSDSSKTTLRVVCAKEKLDNPFRAPRSAEDKPLEGSVPIEVIRMVPVPADKRHIVDLQLEEVSGVLRTLMPAYPDEKIENVFTQNYIKSVNKSLWDACSRIFKDSRNYTLYSARSQWFANRKAEVSLEQVRQEGGHVPGSKTTKRNYGYRRLAHFKSETEASVNVELRSTPKVKGAPDRPNPFSAHSPR